MRNINRIEPFLKKLQNLWSSRPDLRFGQIISILEDKLDKDSFNAEEDENNYDGMPRDWVINAMPNLK